MFCSFLDHGNQDETHKTIRHAFIGDHVLDLLYQENSGHADASKRYCYGYDAFGHSKLGSFAFPVSILILLLVEFQNFVEDRMVTMKVVEQVPREGKKKGRLGDEISRIELSHRELTSGRHL